MKSFVLKFSMITAGSLLLAACGIDAEIKPLTTLDPTAQTTSDAPQSFHQDMDVEPTQPPSKLEELHEKKEEAEQKNRPAPVTSYLNNGPYWVKYPWVKVTDGNQWTAFIQNFLRNETPELLKVVPKDAARFCQNYAHLDTEQRLAFWTRWISVLAEMESTYSPQTVTHDIQVGPDIYSAGLLQISHRSVREGNYGCEMIKEAKDLLDPLKNLGCGMRIMKKFILQDGYIAHYDENDRKSSWRGASRYWAPLRSSRLKTPEARADLEELLLKKRSGWAKSGLSDSHPALKDEDHRESKESFFEKFLRLMNSTPFCNPSPLR